MGAIAEGIVAYAQPLLDQTDGSVEQMDKAFAITHMCFNLALMPEDLREKALSETKLDLEMDDEEFEDFRRSIIDPMIRRHAEMFPLMHRRAPADVAHSGCSPSDSSLRARPSGAARVEAYPGTDRYAPCPCNSGRKYKFCCGKNGR